MGEDDPSRAHTFIKKLKAQFRALVTVNVEVDQGEGLLFYRIGGIRKDSLVKEDISSNIFAGVFD